MTNHPNRSGKSSARNPNPGEIKAARIAAGLSQAAAGDMVFVNVNTWQQYEAEKGTAHHRRMHPAFWDLFQRKVKELTE